MASPSSTILNLASLEDKTNLVDQLLSHSFGGPLGVNDKVSVWVLSQ